ncbi:MAG TPA: hypothetical protein VLL08_33140 [Kineosporiaceae bacterium]|nr:hypothetical protein [Kineosporiaceae bacterium]
MSEVTVSASNRTACDQDIIPGAELEEPAGLGKVIIPVLRI